MVWLSARGGWGEVSQGGLPGLGCAASQASLLSPSRHTATFGLEPGPGARAGLWCVGYRPDCPLSGPQLPTLGPSQRRLSQRHCPHARPCFCSPAAQFRMQLAAQPGGAAGQACGCGEGWGRRAEGFHPGRKGVRGYPREEAGSKLPLIPWQLSEGGNVVCHFTATEVQLGPRRVPGNSGSSPWARSSSGFKAHCMSPCPRE